MQRLHQEDLIGVVMEREPWEVLSLPAIAREDEHFEYEDIFGSHVFQRKVGDVLHPERDPLKAYESLRQTMTEYDFQCQFQQDPMPPGGNIIKREWPCFCEPAQWPKSFSYTLQSWDTANKSGDLNDFSVCTTWGLNDGKYYLCHVYRRRVGFPELKRAVAELKEQFDPNKVLIEDKSSGTPLIQELASEYIFGIEAYQPPPGSNKHLRLAAQSIKFEAGKVILPTQAPWLDEYLREITGFPGGKYDDQVDSTSQALEFLGPLAGSIISCSYRWPLLRGYETC
jgi:predicted phage terminase large subunit-like protein